MREPASRPAVMAAVAMAVFAAWGGLGNAAEASRPPQSATNHTGGVAIAAMRTPAHVERSSDEVYQSVLGELEGSLRDRRVLVATAEILHLSPVPPDDVSVEGVLRVARQIGAGSLLYIEVDRPFSRWLKLKLRCYDATGELVWEHTEQTGRSGFRSEGQVAETVARMLGVLGGHVGERGLPLIPTAADRR